MNTSTNKELKSFEDLAANFANKELLENREENDRYPFGSFFTDVLDKAFDVGFFGITLPEDLGGVGQGVSALSVILNNISKVDASLAAIIFTNVIAQEIMLNSGSSENLKKITTISENYKEFLIAFPSYDNPSEIKSAVEVNKEGEKYILSGKVDYLVLGDFTKYALIPAVKGKDVGCSYFLIDLSSSGVVKSDPVLSLGLRACPAVDVKLNNVEGEIIGEEGKGFTYFEEVSDRMSVAQASMATGIMKGSFDEAFEYAKDRFQGGCEIINWSEIKMILSNLGIKTKIAELALCRACEAVDNKEGDYGLSSRAASIYIQEMATELTTDGIQVLGGNGYMKDYGQEKRFRDAKQSQCLLGISQMKKICYMERIIGQ